MKKTIYIGIIILLFAVKSFAGNISGPDSLGKSDPKNWDPNDPNCPCHQYQKQAEDEWNKMNQNIVANNADSAVVNADPDLNSIQQVQSNNAVTQHRKNYFHFEKFLIQKIHRMKRNLIGGTKRSVKGKFRLVDCFHF
ncbi:MAG: hypothetical protein HY064_10070 [Bacteroidetes bacterium]|nr:hypothetical protein [Bacteroidota bacterium]